MKTNYLLPLFLAVAAAAQQPDQAHDLYLLAATPSGKLNISYPATLYVAEGGKPVVVREIAAGSGGVQYVLAGDDALVVGYPRIEPDKLSIIHFDSPSVADLVNLPGSLPVVQSVMTHFPGVTSTIALTRVVSSEPFVTELLGVAVAGSGPSRISPLLDWNALAGIWWEGEIGGPQPNALPVVPNLSSQGLRFFVPALRRYIALRGDIRSLPTRLSSGQEGMPVNLRAANDLYVVFSTSPSQTFVETLKDGATQLLNLDSGVTGDSPRLRLFGAWLAVTGVERSAGDKGQAPGIENQRTKGTPELPPVATLYAENMSSRRLLGVLELYNLATGERIVVHTGQADSEVLRVSGGEVLYRVNQQIFQASIAGSRLGLARLVAEGEDVPEVHWAFRGPER